MGVFGSITFPHTPEEAMSGDWQKLVFLLKINPVEEKLIFLMNIKQEEKSTFLYETGVWPEKCFHLAAMGKIRKENGQLQEPPQIYNQMS